MLSVYPACFFKDDGAYSVVFPDLNWLATSGGSEAEAMEMAVDCLAGYLYTLRQCGEQAPKASCIGEVSLEEVAEQLGAEAAGGFVNLVTVDLDSYAKDHLERSVRKTLTIPAWLNAAAIEKDNNFSQALQEALIEKIRS